jgi:hypothetical protein
MLRMGKVVPKNYMAMVFESVTKKESTNTDTGLQGLLGRMCGYASDEHGFNIDIYIDEYIINEIKVYLDGYNSNTGPLNSRAMNVRKTPKNINKSEFNQKYIKLPKDVLFHSKTGGVDMKHTSTWVDENMDKLLGNFSDIERNEIKAELSSGVLKFKNLNAKCNKSIKDQILAGSEVIINKNLQETSYLCKEKGIENIDIWLVINNNNQRENTENIVDITPLKEQIHPIIENKCVFKPPQLQIINPMLKV